MRRERLPLILILLFFLLSLLLAGCVPPPEAANQTAFVPPTSDSAQAQVSQTIAVPLQTAVPLEQATASGTPGSANPDQRNPTETLTAGSSQVESPTEDPRPDPEDWQNWPVLPEHISARAREIYLRGLEMGNDPHAFSVTGDCQAIRDVMLGEFDDPRKYTLKFNEAYLSEAIDWFQGSFNRNGAAVRGGFTAASVLSPLHADPQICKSGETPLGCEFRLHNPSILIVSLEVWNDRAHLERYELYLRQIIEYSIEEGVLPILMTKADMAEALEHVINPLLVQLAYEYDLPLVNFWLAVQPLPNHGIDPDRDGFHISEEAWWVKSSTALKALDEVWRGVNTTAAVKEASPTIRPSKTSSPPVTAVSASPTPTPLPICNPPENCALFSLIQMQSGRLEGAGIYLLDIPTGRLAQVTGRGYHLHAVSPDGRQMLVSQGSDLYRMEVNGTNPLLLTGDFFEPSETGAIWLDGETLALISDRDGVAAIWLHDLKSGSWRRVSALDDRPIRLYPSPDHEKIYWEAGECSQGACTPEGVWMTDVRGGSIWLEGVQQPAFSPDGEHFAFMDPAYTYEHQFDANFKLVVENLELRLPSRRLVSFPAATGFQVRNRLESYSWSADSSMVMIFLDERSNYYEKSAGYHTFLFLLDSGILLEYERLIGDVPRMAWASDSRRILFAITKIEPDGSYSIRLNLLEPFTRINQGYGLIPELTSQEYVFIDRMVWLP